MFEHPNRRDVLIALTLFMLNVFDAIATIVVLDRGAVELNPFMSMLIDLGIGYFLTFKIVFVGTFTWFLLYLSFDRHVNMVIWTITIIYALLTMYHLINLWSLL